MKRSVQTVCGWACGLALLPALAAPLVEPTERERLQQTTSAAAPSESPVDVQGWIQRETTTALLDTAIEHDRGLLLRHGWQGRPPTWIQDSAQVNLADFPTLDRTAENAERDLQTLEWVLEQQRRAASGEPRVAADDGPDAAPPDNWLRRLLPTQWIATLKANREWVAAGGTALLVIVWGTTMFARRPTGQPRPPAPVEVKPQRRRRRHRDAQPTAG